MDRTSPVDVVVVGAGIIGAAVARELSRFSIRTALLEREADVGFGSTKASTAIIHPGFPVADAPLKTKLVLEGNRVFPRLAEELQFSFQQLGELQVAMSDEELTGVRQTREEATAAGVERLEIVGPGRARELEPHLSPKARGALHAPTAGIVLPFEVTIALVENAAANGVDVRLNTKVEGLTRADGCLVVQTSTGPLRTRYVVNAAGLYADEVAGLAGPTDFTILPHRGEECLLDNRVGYLLHRPVFPLIPWSLIIPTVDGNICLGTTYDLLEDRLDAGTTSAGSASIFERARTLIPALSPRDMIKSFAGVRGMNSRTGDYIIEPCPHEPHLINAVIGSPGITSAPAIAVMVTDLLREGGLRLSPNPQFQAYRTRIPRFSEASCAEQRALIARDPRYAHVVCRCETVTEGEIVEAIRRGARTVDGVKYRTRAGMGRCQGGFCGPQVVRILARELGVPVTEVTKKGPASRMLPFHSKELLHQVYEERT